MPGAAKSAELPPREEAEVVEGGEEEERGDPADDRIEGLEGVVENEEETDEEEVGIEEKGEEEVWLRVFETVANEAHG